MVVCGTCVVLKGIAMESGVMGEDTVKSWKENRNHIQRREKSWAWCVSIWGVK